jgi:hypothetical protein
MLSDSGTGSYNSFCEYTSRAIRLARGLEEQLDEDYLGVAFSNRERYEELF